MQQLTYNEQNSPMCSTSPIDSSTYATQVDRFAQIDYLTKKAVSSNCGSTSIGVSCSTNSLESPAPGESTGDPHDQPNCAFDTCTNCDKCGNKRELNNCADIEDDCRARSTDSERNSTSRLLVDSQPNGSCCRTDKSSTTCRNDKSNCAFCYQLGVLTDHSKIDRSLLKHLNGEENNNCDLVHQMNQSDETSNYPKDNLLSNDRIDQGDPVNQQGDCRNEPQHDVPQQLNRESIIDKTIIDAKFRNDDYLCRQRNQRTHSRLSLIRNFFRFKSGAKRCRAADKYPINNQSSLDANLIEFQLNSSISAPVISTSNDQAAKQAMSTCSINNNSTNHSPAALNSSTNSNNNVIVLKRTDSSNDDLHVERDEEREMWSKKTEFLLAVIGFAVDLGNVWR